MAFGLIIIGTELMTGKRRDRHLDHAIQTLGERGLELAWAHYVGDEPERIVATLRHTLVQGDIVFCFGGIGATPDDHTRRCVAEALGTSLVVHPEALREIEAQFGDEARPHRVKMAELPRGCDLIPNPYNRVPGFSVEGHHFLPGFPHMAWPMMEWVLEHRYRHLFIERPPEERLVTAFGASESRLMVLMESFVERYPDLQLSSLPHLTGDEPQVELGVRGDHEQVAEAMAWLTGQLDSLGLEWKRAE
jgi:molybdopterin-biosynthesis enzyme MoeA-like protein